MSSATQQCQADKPCDSEHWQRHKLQLPSLANVALFMWALDTVVYPRVSQRDVIRVDIDMDQSAGELSQAPIFLARMFVLWYVFYVASHMDITRDVEGTLLYSDIHCVCRGVKSRLF